MANPLDGLHDADHAKAEKTEGRMPSVSDRRALARLLELILSTAQAGLAFSKDRFDIGRFRALQHAVAEFIASDQGWRTNGSRTGSLWTATTRPRNWTSVR